MGLLIYLIKLLHPSTHERTIPQHIQWWVGGAIALTLIQIVLGTQVRQFIDDQIHQLGEDAKNLWLADPTVKFYIHRSLSLLVLLTNGYVFWKIRQGKLPLQKINWVMGILVLEIASGIAMYYGDFPFGSQPLHLVLASLLFGIQFYLLLEAIAPQKRVKSS